MQRKCKKELKLLGAIRRNRLNMIITFLHLFIYLFIEIKKMAE